MGSRHSSYNSHASRLSYNSHDLLSGGGRHGGGGFGHAITKESQLLQRAKTLYGHGDHERSYKQYDGVSIQLCKLEVRVRVKLQNNGQF